jgi:hypothetical protein
VGVYSDVLLPVHRKRADPIQTDMFMHTNVNEHYSVQESNSIITIFHYGFRYLVSMKTMGVLWLT